MQSADLEVLKDIPGYKAILKAVLKSQIQQLVEQLADHTGEESVILTASVSDGSLSHLGSESGKVFLEDHDDIKSQFLGFCLKRYHLEKQSKLIAEKQKETITGPGPQPANCTPNIVYAPPKHFPPQSPRSVHLVSPQGLPQISMKSVSHVRHEFHVSHMRHEPYYHIVRPQRKAQNSDSHSTVTGSSDTIKVEPMDDSEKTVENTNNLERKPLADADNMHSDILRAGQLCLDPSVSSHLVNEPASSSTTTTIPNDLPEVKYSNTVTAEELSLDSNLSKPTENPPKAQNMDISKTQTSDSAKAELDLNENIKVEANSESELYLEITGVEPGQIAKPNNKQWMANIQTRMGYATTSGNTQSDMASQSSQGCDLVERLHGPEPHHQIEIETNLEQCQTKPVWNDPETSYFKHVCNLCSKGFINRTALEMHLNVHTGEKPYSCSKCLAKFSHKSNLQRHLKRQNCKNWAEFFKGT